MTFAIALTLAVIVLTLLAFLFEWGPPDIISLTVLCVLVPLGLVDVDKITEVFKNEATITIASLFVIGGALEKTGGVDQVGRIIRARLNTGLRGTILAFSVITAFFSAWMNNTAVVAILLPVALGLARSRSISSSKLLMPLSYAAIFGGCCTLIGTSTNLVVNGVLKELGQTPLAMFELTSVGVPIAIVGIAYLVLFGPKLIPDRASISGSLDIDLRITPLYHVLIGKQSQIIGRPFMQTPLFDPGHGVQILEVRRNGQRLMTPLNGLVIEKNDRFLVGLHRRDGKKQSPEETFAAIGGEILSTIDGLVTELIIREECDMVDETLAHSDFRQRYNALVIAVHRDGRNITKELADLPLEHGDTLLVVTPANNLATIAASRNFVLTDAPDEVAPKEKIADHKATIAWLILGGVVVTATVSDLFHGSFGSIPAIPIHFSALVGALLVVWLKLLTPREAYASVDWPIIFMLYGLLGLGLAMQSTGTATWLAHEMVSGASSVFSPAHLPYASLVLCYLLTLILTEMLSNNAVALMMTPIMVKMAYELHVSPRPYIIAVAIAASSAFAIPMGYQTHMMVYGPGGYRFSDFLRVGIPLNVLAWITACAIIPFVWHF